ncbi:hypothetical protein FRC12_006506 [Ceratobasidium sp. 428]|nr:hypothetical protein FRC12_006506 [Ceratobasidium sp. 428]
MLQRILNGAGQGGLGGGIGAGGGLSRLAFEADSSDEEMEEDDDMPGSAGRLFGNRTRGLGEEDEDEQMKDGGGERKELDSLKAQLDELTDGLEDEVEQVEGGKGPDGVNKESEHDETQLNGYAASKVPTSIGSPLVPTPQVLRENVRTPSPNLTSAS